MRIENAEKIPNIVRKSIVGIPANTVFCGNFNGYQGVFLKIYDGMVFLNDASKVWDIKSGENDDAFIDGFRKLKVKLVVEGEE